MASAEPITADNVVLALGFHAFTHIPDDVAAMLPPGRYGHTCDVVDLTAFRGKCCLIVGGRQSAFEWTALLHEQGAASVDVCYRHDTPEFTQSDWSWFNRQVVRRRMRCGDAARSFSRTGFHLRRHGGPADARRDADAGPRPADHDR